MDRFRRVLRLLIFVVATVVFSTVIWFALFYAGRSFFGETGTPECTDSDTCGAWGDFLYRWPGEIVCLLLAATLAWLLIRRIRR
jgi:hypothetical protein